MGSTVGAFTIKNSVSSWEDAETILPSFKPRPHPGSFEVGLSPRSCHLWIAAHFFLSQILHEELTRGSLILPKPFEDHAKLLERFSSLCHFANTTMLSCLSDALKLEGSSRFESSHRGDKASDTSLKLIYEPMRNKCADWSDNTHTDGGTLTILFCDHWGNRLEDPETKAWTFIEPKPGCALINVADSLQSLSGGKLHSCRHGVTQPVDGFQKRYFVASYLRPDKTI